MDLCILPLGSYDIVLGIDWLATHQANIDCHRKVVQCVDDTGGQVELLGVQRPVSLRMISANQLKRSVRKGCQLFLVSLSDLEEAKSRTVTLDDHPLLREYADVFPDEIPGMPPQRDIDFQIDLVPRVEPISQAPYHMTI